MGTGVEKRLSGKPDGLYILVASVNEEVVGNSDLSTSSGTPRRGHAGDVAMAVRDDWQGKGIGTALMEVALDLADNWLDLRRLELNVYTDNSSRVTLYERFGFEIEVTHRRYAYRDSEYVDAYSMGRVS